ncbi:MAG TPA: hypothetical protein VFK38_05180 [Candidatus Limnocylindrales bacterium]|nr:hypothetical protein [Candidatus Limnocylindrales bacterium]
MDGTVSLEPRSLGALRPVFSTAPRGRPLPAPLRAILVLALLGAALLAPGLARVAQASCMPLDLTAVRAQGDAVVFAGTVLGEEPGGTRMVVEQWYQGNAARDQVVVSGGKATPGAVSSIDWMAGPGQAWVVVARRDANGRLATEPCQQMSVDQATLDQLKAIFGAPQTPPFEQGGPGSDAAAAQSVPVPIIGGLLGLVAAAIGFLVVRLRRAEPAGR